MALRDNEIGAFRRVTNDEQRNNTGIRSPSAGRTDAHAASISCIWAQQSTSNVLELTLLKTQLRAMTTPTWLAYAEQASR